MKAVFLKITGLYFILLPITPRMGEVRVDYLFMPIMYCFLFLFVISRLKIDRSSLFILSVFVVLPFIITIYSKWFYGNSFVLRDFYYYFGASRIFTIFYLTYLFLKLGWWNQSDVRRVITYVSVVICFAGMLELFYKDLSFLFLDLFSNPLDVQQIELQISSSVSRAISTVGHSSALAFFSLILVSCSLNFYQQKNLSKYLLLTIAVLCGIATYSKIFFLGLPVLLIYRAVMFKQKSTFLDLIWIIIIAFLIYSLFGFNNQFYYVVNTILSGGFDGILGTRLGTDGNLHKPMQVLAETYYIGIGSDTTLGVLKSDSLFLTLALLTGCMGLFVVLFYWLRESFLIYRQVIRNYSNY